MVGTPPESFGARRVGEESEIRVTAEDLAEVFDPTGFNNGWTPGEVERVVIALPDLQLPFDAANIAPTIETLDRIAFEARTTDSTSALVDADVAQSNGGFALWGDVTDPLDYRLWALSLIWS